MKTTFLGLTLVVLLLSGSYATKGVDVYTAVSTAAWKCIAPGFAIIRGYCSNGTVDPKAKQTIANAHSAGVPYVDVYHCPCTSQSATSQANSLLSKISASSFGTLWIDVETNPSSGCGWGSPSASCTFLQQLVTAYQNLGITVGIFSSYYMWQTIMGSASACTDFSSLPLWYPFYDGYSAFTDFFSFGGWTTPAMKQYQGTTSVCGVGVDLDYQ